MSLEKHESVLKLHNTQMIEEVHQVCFVQDHTPPGSHPDTLWLAEDLWDDMGNPDTITLTVVPGDTLNEQQDDEELSLAEAESILRDETGIAPV